MSSNRRFRTEKTSRMAGISIWVAAIMSVAMLSLAPQSLAATPTSTPTATPTVQPTVVAQSTATPVSTSTSTQTPTITPTATSTPVVTQTVGTQTPVATQTVGTQTPLATQTTVATSTPTATPTTVIGSGVNLSVNPVSADTVAGTAAVYNIVISNTGETSETYYFDKVDSDTLLFTSSYSATTYAGPYRTPAVGPLAPGQSGSLQLTVTPNQGTWAGATNVTRINAVRGGTSDISTVVVTTRVKANFGVAITADPGSLTVQPGKAVTYSVLVTNTGNITDSITLGVQGSDTQKFSARVSAASLALLGPGAGTKVLLIIDASASALQGAANTATITASSSGGTSVTAQTSVLTTVGPVYRINADISPSTVLVEPGGSQTFELSITNAGNVTDNVKLTFTNANDRDFELQNTRNQVGLTPGSNTTIPFVVKPKARVADDASTTISIAVSGKNGTLPAINLTAIASITVTHRLQIAVDPITSTTPFNTPVNYIIIVTNTGNVTDDIELTTPNDKTKFESELSSSKLKDLAPGESRIVKMEVNPRRSISREYGNRVSKKGYQSQPGDLETFRLVSTPYDATEITASIGGIITATSVVTTTSLPPKISIPEIVKDDLDEYEAERMYSRAVSNKIYRPTIEDNGVTSWFKAVVDTIGEQIDNFWKAMPWNAKTTAKPDKVEEMSLNLKESNDGTSVQSSPAAKTSGRLILEDAEAVEFEHKGEWNYTGSNTPHAKNPTTCAYCHEVHGAAQGDSATGNSKLLMKSSKRLTSIGGQPGYVNDGIARAQCDSCHDGTGSKYKTEWGKIEPQGGGSATALGGATKRSNESQSTSVGSGYTYSTYTANTTMVDFVTSGAATTDITVGATQAMSSSHKIEESRTPPYSTGISADILRCSSCHDPHGVDKNPDNSYNYRQFRQTVTFGGANKVVRFSASLSISNPPTETVSLQSGTVSACTSCHNDTGALKHGQNGNIFSGGHSSLNNIPFPRYMYNTNTNAMDVWTTFKSNGYGIFSTEKNTGNKDIEPGYPNRFMVCLTCHRSHGAGYQTGDVFPLRRPEFAAIESNPSIFNGWCGACHTAY